MMFDTQLQNVNGLPQLQLSFVTHTAIGLKTVARLLCVCVVSTKGSR